MLGPEKILALDMSTKTGWSIMTSSEDGIVLTDYGQIESISEPEGVYPHNYVEWAYQCFDVIVELVDRFAPDILVIEETCAGSKEVYSQKILEWLHFLVAKMIRDSGIRVTYLLTGAWRSEVGAKMTRDESKHNKYVREYKKENGTRLARNKDGKIVGIKTKKHVNIRRANEVFESYLREPLRKKDEDTADSMLLGYCYHLRRIKYESRTKSLGR